MPFSSLSFSGMYPFLLRLHGQIAFLGGRFSSLGSLFSWEVFDRICQAAAQIPRQIASVTYGCVILVPVVRSS